MAKTATITVRDVPEEVLRVLRQRARAAGRSMQQELLFTLKREAIDRESAIDQLLELRRRHLRRPMTLVEIEEAIDEGRP
jgi:plasmid stability protein